ncbi:hypothetical protein [Listeria rustica]|uniref:Uncharacterized protein n=1 Tax=Listeria rustica TaxID=2713503 RepID=A0A7W1YGR1_9LIST|nr:hypothetical protein [Listeria rustica]MBA3926898.1 hypothetical protein [Listeria rustica]
MNMYFSNLLVGAVQELEGFNIDNALSILAIIISAGVLIVQIVIEKKVNKKNLEFNLFNDIYKEYLIKKIPEAKSFLTFSESRVTGTDTLVQVLNDLRQDSIFYKNTDEKFYLKLIKNVQEFEDDLVKTMNSTYDNDEFAKFINSTNQKYNKISMIIQKKFF